MRKLRLAKGKAQGSGPENRLKPRHPGPEVRAPRLQVPLGLYELPGNLTTSGSLEATAVLTIRLWFLCVAHSQGTGFGLFFVSPYGGIELLMINWTKRDQGTCQTKYGNPGTSNQWGRGRRGAVSPETLTSVVLHVIHCHVGGHKGCLTVFLLVLLLCQQTGLGILRGNDILYFSTKGRKEPCLY